MSRLLTESGHRVSHMKVAQLLHTLHYSLQGNAKTHEGKQHPDRDAQFRYIQRQSEAFLGQNWPVISVDTKKKEQVGNHANSGQEWQPEGQPEQVEVHDFPDPDVPKAVPRGVYFYCNRFFLGAPAAPLGTTRRGGNVLVLWCQA